jgi:hypothetical protein
LRLAINGELVHAQKFREFTRGQSVVRFFNNVCESACHADSVGARVACLARHPPSQRCLGFTGTHGLELISDSQPHPAALNVLSLAKKQSLYQRESLCFQYRRRRRWNFLSTPRKFLCVSCRSSPVLQPSSTTYQSRVPCTMAQACDYFFQLPAYFHFTET